MPTFKKVAFRVALALIVLGVVEGTSFAALQVLEHKGYIGRRLADNPKTPDYERYRRIRHEVLGWPWSEGHDKAGGEYRDRTGARRLAAFPDPSQPSCVSIYGDSFAESYKCDAKHAWSNLVAEELDCRVANYAQAGYGSDQAMLRYRLTPSDHSPIVILSHMSENIQRNLTRIRDLETGSRDLGLKPRFIVNDAGELELVPIPELSESEYERAMGVRAPPLRLEYETFQPGGPLIAPAPSFPYSLSLLRVGDDYRVRARLHGNRPRYTELYEPGNVSGGFELMLALFRTFVREAAERGQRGVVLLLPSWTVLEYHARTGIWIHQKLMEALEREAVPYMDFGPYVEAHAAKPLVDPFYQGNAGGHYGDYGDALVAEFVSSELETRFSDAIAVRAAEKTP